MSEKRKIGIAGVGMVGGAVKKYFENKSNYELFLYDKGKGIGSPEELNKADYIYVCVPTPYNGAKCDISIVEEVITQLDDGKILIIKSTVIPGTTDIIQKKFPNQKVLFVPEFLTEETADQDMSYPDRQIIGYTKESFEHTADIKLQLPLAPYVRIMPALESEMIKYATNCWFTLKVTYANQMYDLCEQTGIDYKMVLEGMAADKRIGRTHLKIDHKGYRGYGGKCLPKDSKALIAYAKENGISFKLLEEADRYNDELVKFQGLDPLNTGSKLDKLEDKEERYTHAKELKIKKENEK